MMTIAAVRDLTGMGWGQIKDGMWRARTDDPLMGACYAHAAGLAVNVGEDRHTWNLRMATVRYTQLTTPHPES